MHLIFTMSCGSSVAALRVSCAQSRLLQPTWLEGGTGLKNNEHYNTLHWEAPCYSGTLYSRASQPWGIWSPDMQIAAWEISIYSQFFPIEDNVFVCLPVMFILYFYGGKKKNTHVETI